MNPTADPEARPPGPEKETGASRAGPRACRGVESNGLCVIGPQGEAGGTDRNRGRHNSELTGSRLFSVEMRIAIPGK